MIVRQRKSSTTTPSILANVPPRTQAFRPGGAGYRRTSGGSDPRLVKNWSKLGNICQNVSTFIQFLIFHIQNVQNFAAMKLVLTVLLGYWLKRVKNHFLVPGPGPAPRVGFTPSPRDATYQAWTPPSSWSTRRSGRGRMRSR